MGIDELAMRVFHRYWLVMILMITVPVAVVGAYARRQPATYTAHTRIIASAQTPRAQAEAAALVSQVFAIATSRDLAQRALADANLNRNPDAVVSDVVVTGLGSSALVDLAYTDRSPVIAQQVTTALAAAVVEQLDAVAVGGLPEVIAGVDKQLTVLAEKQAPIAKQAQQHPQDPVAQNRLAGINRTISDLAGSRGQLAEQLAAAGHATVVSAATVPVADSRGLPVELAIAVLLGLVLALLVIGLNETARPAVSGAARVARLLDVPVLGAISADPAALAEIGRRIRLAARRAGVSTVVLTRVDRAPVPPEVVDRIGVAALRPGPRSGRVSVPLARFEPRPREVADAATPGAVRAPVAVLPVAEDRNDSTRLRHVCGLEELDPEIENERIGVIILTGVLARISAVDDVRGMLAAADWPVLGVLDAAIRRADR